MSVYQYVENTIGPKRFAIFLQVLCQYGWQTGGIIGVSQLDEYSAISLAEKASLELGISVGNYVGVGATFFLKYSKNTKVLYMTEKFLLNEMLEDPLLTKYRIILLCNVNKRTSQTDIILGLLKKILQKRPTLKLLVTTNTPETASLKEYFNARKKNKLEDVCAVISLKRKLHPIKVFYKSEPSADYVKDVVKTVLNIHQKEPSGNILVFLPDNDEVQHCIKLINEIKDQDHIKILPIDGTKNVHSILSTTTEQICKVILVNDIQEQLQHIPGIKYVIDCGILKMKWFNATNRTDTILTIPISKDIAKCRAELAGNCSQGKVYRLYPEGCFLNFPDKIPAEICRTDFASTLLQLKSVGITNVIRFDFPSVPPAKILLAGVETLYALGAIDEIGNLTKPLGYFLSELPCDPMLGRMLYTSILLSCSEEILTIAAMLEVQQFFYKSVSSKFQNKLCKSKRHFEAAEGDLITMLNIFSAFIQNGQTKEFCDMFSLIYSNMKKAVSYREKLKKFLETKCNVHLKSSNGNLDNICKSITSGYFLNAAYLHHSGSYKKLNNGDMVVIDSSSVVYSIPQPQFIIFGNLITNKKTFANSVTVVKKEWLLEMASHYYKIKNN